MAPPHPTPLGPRLADTAKAVRRAFDAALAAEGGSLPVWLILISVKSQDPRNQRDLAAAIGITGATLTHHLNAMERDGLLRRRRDPHNRRIQRVELTRAGELKFAALRNAATTFDRRLRGDLSPEECATLGALLDRLQAHVSEDN